MPTDAKTYINPKKVTNSPNAVLIDAYSIMSIFHVRPCFSLPLLTSSPSLQLPAVPFSPPPHHQLGKHSDTRSPRFSLGHSTNYAIFIIINHQTTFGLSLPLHPILPISFHCTNLVCWQPCCTALQTLFKGPAPAPPFHN